MLLSLRPLIVQVAQEVYDAWNADHDEYGDVEFGFGGICDAISREIENIIVNNTDFEVAEGGEPGGDHSWVIIKTPEGYYTIDIPCHLYERGGGYQWQKIPDVQFNAEDISIEYLGEEDYYWPYEFD